MAKLFRKLAFAYLAVTMAAAVAWPVSAKETVPENAPENAPYCEARARKGCDVELSKLPAEAQKIHALILVGGPFKYDKDGVPFSNRESLLKRERRGYYREYTVRTPGERSRGARRFVCGGKDPKAPDACYYTDDHYASFRRVTTAP
jgi:ribonuclease T1